MRPTSLARYNGPIAAKKIAGWLFLDAHDGCHVSICVLLIMYKISKTYMQLGMIYTACSHLSLDGWIGSTVDFYVNSSWGLTKLLLHEP